MILGVVAIAIWIEWFGGWCFVEPLLTGNRGPIYSAMASVFGALLGFVLTAVSIVLGFSGMEPMSVVRSSPHYQTLYQIFLRATWALALATLLALLGLVFDRDRNPVTMLLYCNLAASGVASVLVARCVWALERVVLLIIWKKGP